MKTENLNQIKNRLVNATKGIWMTSKAELYVKTEQGRYQTVVESWLDSEGTTDGLEYAKLILQWKSEQDKEFILHAVDDMQMLLYIIEQQQKQLDGFAKV